MKRLSLFLLILWPSSLAAARVSLDDAVLPRKTEIFIELERALSSKTTSAGERFYGKVQVPVTLNDQIIIPAGAFVLGKVQSTVKPGYFKGTGEIEITFDQIIFPDGRTRQMLAVPQSAEGLQVGQEREEGKIKADSDQSDEVINTSVIGGVLGGSEGGANDGVPGYGIGSVIGAATGAVVGLVFRGKHVTLPKGASLSLQLQHDTRFARVPATPAGKVLHP